NIELSGWVARSQERGGFRHLIRLRCWVGWALGGGLGGAFRLGACGEQGGELERRYMLDVLDAADGNKSRATRSRVCSARARARVRAGEQRRAARERRAVS